MPITSGTIVFVTGAFISHLSWKPWIAYFEDKGFTCLAPAWPHKDAPPQQLREQAGNSPLINLQFNDLLNYYASFIENLPEKPIAIGHSLGGLIVQILVNREKVKAGVAIHSVPPQGIFSFEWPLFKSMWKPLGYFSSSKKLYMMTLKEWQYSFTNGMPEEEQADTYEKFVTPESKQVLRGTFSKGTKIDYSKLHPPLLILAGGNNNLVTATLNYNNYLRYDRNHSVTDYKEFKDKNHFITGHKGWQDEAFYILSWLEVLPSD